MQKEKTYFGLYKARRRRRFFGGIFGMRNFGLNFPPPYFFKKVARRGGEVGSNTADNGLISTFHLYQTQSSGEEKSEYCS